MAWTVAPAIVLAVIIVLGLQSWNSITDMSGNFVIQEHTNLMLDPDNGSVMTDFEVMAAYETSDGAGAHLSGLGGDAKSVLVEKDGSWVVQTYEMEGDTALVITGNE